MKQIEIVNNVEIEVVSSDDTFLVSNKEVAIAFGVSESNIRSHKSNREFVKGVHYTDTLISTGGGDQYKTMWTKKGIITLGYRLRETEFTIAFRDWASDYIINGGEVQPQLTNAQIMANALQIADKEINDMKSKNEALLGANNLLVDKNEKLYNKVEEVSEVLHERDLMIEHITDRSKSVSIGDWAKMIFDHNGLDIGRNRLFKMLRHLGYLMNGNTPKQNFIAQKLFKIVDASYNHPFSGERVFDTKTEVTYKGIDNITPKIIDYYHSEF